MRSSRPRAGFQRPTAFQFKPDGSPRWKERFTVKRSSSSLRLRQLVAVACSFRSTAASRTASDRRTSSILCRTDEASVFVSHIVTASPFGAICGIGSFGGCGTSTSSVCLISHRRTSSCSLTAASTYADRASSSVAALDPSARTPGTSSLTYCQSKTFDLSRLTADLRISSSLSTCSSSQASSQACTSGSSLITNSTFAFSSSFSHV